MPNNFSLSVEGLDRVLTAFDELTPQTQQRISTKLSRAADATLADARARSRAAYDTGRLYASGHVSYSSGSNAQFQFGWDVTFGDGSSTSTIYTYPDNGLNGDMQADGYSWFVELGTSKMAPRPYLGSAFEEQSQKLVTSIGDVLGG